MWDSKRKMVIRVVHIAPTDRGLRLGAGLDGFEEAMHKYAIEAMSAGLLGVRASRNIDAGTLVETPARPNSATCGNARIVRDETGKRRVITTRAVRRDEEITVCGEPCPSDDETMTRARRDLRRGLRHSAPVAGQDWYKSALGERYIHRALSALKIKPERV